MRILVTGAAGFVGSHLSEQLLAEGHQVVGLDAFIPYYPREVKERNIAALGHHPAFTFHEIDLRSDAIEPALEGVDAVINQAAMAGLMRSWTDLEAYASCNLIGLGRLLQACDAVGVGRFVHVSTSSVYGSDAVGDENQPTRPISPYGVTKLAAEHLLLAHIVRFGLNASILRYFSIYGPRQRPDMAYHRFAEAMLDGRSITVFGDGHQSRSNTYISDCVRGTIQALDGAEPGEIYNIGGGESLELCQAISIIAEALDVEPRIEYQPARPGDQRHTRADTGKAQRAFGYEPTVPAAIGLREQVAWHVAARG